MVRLEEGVGVFRGSIDGDLDNRPAETGSATGVDGAATGTGMPAGNVDRRRALLVSVGLIVRAPRPVACEADGGIPGMTDILFADEVGVVGLRVSRCGDLSVKDEDRPCSGVKLGVKDEKLTCLEGGSSDFDFVDRGVLKTRSPMLFDPLLRAAESERSDMLLIEGLAVKLGRLRCDVCLVSCPSPVPAPPIDFRGPFPVLLRPVIGGY